MAIPIQSGKFPEAGNIELDPSSGRYQIFDPTYGSEGEYRQASASELQTALQTIPDFNLPFN